MNNQYAIDPVWASVIVAAVLVLITFWQMMEARKLRLESVRPALSLEPAEYVIDGGPLVFLLVNDGALARDLEIDVSYDGTKHSMFLSSLSKDEKSPIVQDVQELSQKGSRLFVHVSYKDVYGKKHQENLHVDFEQLKKEGRPFPYITGPWDIVARSLKDIEDRLRDIERKLEGRYR